MNYQKSLFVEPLERVEVMEVSVEVIVQLLQEDLDFHDSDSGYASHNFHSFPAKFPPQLPRKFIISLTQPGDVVLDPMVGSGTTLLEAVLAGRRAIGFDIDPMAIMISNVKITPLDLFEVANMSRRIVTQARNNLLRYPELLETLLSRRWDSKTREFVDYWFLPQTQLELMALLHEIEGIPDARLRHFFNLAFSAIIITKSGGVSLALDLAHTRPHRAKIVKTKAGKIVQGEQYVGQFAQRERYVTKIQRSPIEEFEKRIQSNITGLIGPIGSETQSLALFGNAEAIPLRDASVDLIVTSPPYASNAIDYMRAHKFSLVWLEHSITALGEKRKAYVGGEAITGFCFEELPEYVAQVVATIAALDEKKGQVLYRYYSEMRRVLQQMFRVLKPGKVAILVVGNSVMRGRDTETQNCLAAIGRQIGFDVPGIGVRNLDRNRRMLPAGEKVEGESQIERRMHEEYVIAFYKPVERRSL